MRSRSFRLGADGAEPGPRRVLAYGANRSPAGLARKVGPDPDPPVALVHAWLHDFDVVYSAHVSTYGALPAALQLSPGASVSVHVMHLTDAQLAAIGVAEPNYRRSRLEGIGLVLEGGGCLDAVEAYLTRHGCLALGGTERALAAIAAEGRAFPALTTAEALAAVRDRLAPGEELDSFVLAGAADPVVRAERTARLRADARPLAWPHWRALED